MPKFLSLGALTTLAVLSMRGMAAIGPASNLNIVNAVVSPDGFSRSAVLSEGVVDRTIISGQKVGGTYSYHDMLTTRTRSQGDTFQINVVNNLDDSTMNQTTSIVRSACAPPNTALNLL